MSSKENWDDSFIAKYPCFTMSYSRPQLLSVWNSPRHIFQLRVHGPALVDVRWFHHVALHVSYLDIHKRGLTTGKHHPELSLYPWWFCLTKWRKKNVGHQRPKIKILRHHALCAWCEHRFEMIRRSWWKLAMTGFVQYKITARWMFTTPALTQKNLSVSDPDSARCLQLRPSNSCLSGKAFWKDWL